MAPKEEKNMTFSDVFKSSFLEKAVEFSIVDILIAMALAFCISLFIFYVYKKTYTGVMYSASFGVSLMAMTLITTLIILAITSNVILSLGMVGALSIVRFRTAVKEPLDIAFLFWSISVGIVTGAGLITLAVIGSLIIGIILLLFANKKSTDTPYIMVLSLADDQAEAEAMQMLRDNTKKRLIKSKTVTQNGIELTVEVRITDESARLVNDLLTVNGVTSACLVSYNGEYVA